MMQIRFESITDQNREAILALQIHESQQGYIESVEDCLKEATEANCWRPVGIYDGEILVGFAMYGFFWKYLPFGRVWMDRLLIDKQFQGRGYGKAILPLLLERLQKEYGRRKIYLSVIAENQGAIHLYEQYGFHFTGELDIHGEKVMMRKSV